MTTSILELEPKRVWYYFNEICKIPHESYNEAPLREYLVGFSKEKGLEYKVDKAGNIVISKKASPNCKCAKPIVLQGHLDMICTKDEGLQHDFKKDPIKPKVEGDWVKASGTSLGSDNGIAIAAALALLEDESLTHGPIEALFTAAEEPGMIGALALDPDMLKGRTMLNMDSEDPVRSLYIGCAGGLFTDVRFPIKREAVPGGYSGLLFEVSGLKGGHSGVNIHEQRGNAIKIAARLLSDVKREHDLILADFASGSMANVIPSRAEASVAVKEADVQKIEGFVEKLAVQYKKELDAIDPELSIKVKRKPLKEMLERPLSGRIIDYANASPNGVITMSYDIKDLVQTSTNVGVVKTDGNDLLFIHLSRSSVDSEKFAIAERLDSLARLAGVKAVHNKNYPGWKPNLKSPVLNLTKGVFKNLFGEEPNLMAIHAGLECGVIQEKFPGMDPIALSTDLVAAHSVDERIRISSVVDFWRLVRGVIEEFAKG